MRTSTSCIYFEVGNSNAMKVAYYTNEKENSI